MIMMIPFFYLRLQGKHYPVNVFEVSPPGPTADQDAAAAAAAAFGTGALSRLPSDEPPEVPAPDAPDAASSLPLSTMHAAAAQLKPIVGRQVCLQTFNNAPTAIILCIEH